MIPASATLITTSAKVNPQLLPLRKLFRSAELVRLLKILIALAAKPTG